MEARSPDAVPSGAPEVSLRVRPLTCGRCGGVFEAGAKACPFCGGGIALEDRRLAGVCPACFARLPLDAKFCRGCGRAVDVQELAALKTHAACPRCSSGLRLRHLGDVEMTECSSCGGLWLSPGLLEDLCTRADRSALVRTALDGAPAPLAPVDADEQRYLPCVACGDFMVRKNFGGSSGILIDVCGRHGVWLDDGELQRVMDFVSAGGLERRRARELERERRARLEAPWPMPVLPDDRSPEREDPDLGLALAWIARGIGRLFAR